MTLLRFYSNFQLWLIQHRNFFTKAILSLFAKIDLLSISKDPGSFLESRRNIMGSNFAANGKIIVGDYSLVAEMLNAPQMRSNLLAGSRVDVDAFSEKFPLFLSDAEVAENDTANKFPKETHATVHNHIWNEIIPPAMSRIQQNGEIFKGYLREGLKRYHKHKDTIQDGGEKMELQKMSIRYILHAVLGTPSTNEHGEDIPLVNTVYELTFGKAAKVNLVLSAAIVPKFLLGNDRTSKINEVIDFIMKSPFMKDYKPNESNANQSRETYAQLLFEVMSIAASVGITNLADSVLTKVPKDANIDMNDKHDVMKAVMEAGRLKTPVNYVHTELPIGRTINIDGKDREIAPGTPVILCFYLASLDPYVFEKPEMFNHHRDNLLSHTVMFNSVGFQATGPGKRTCPGRNIALNAVSDLFLMESEALKTD